MLREVVTIDEDLCDGCGLCVPACHAGALKIVRGKARLVAADRLSVTYADLRPEMLGGYPLTTACPKLGSTHGCSGGSWR